jgi:hypothetical protein
MINLTLLYITYILTSSDTNNMRSNQDSSTINTSDEGSGRAKRVYRTPIEIVPKRFSSLGSKRTRDQYVDNGDKIEVNPKYYGSFRSKSGDKKAPSVPPKPFKDKEDNDSREDSSSDVNNLINVFGGKAVNKDIIQIPRKAVLGIIGDDNGELKIIKKLGTSDRRQNEKESDKAGEVNVDIAEESDKAGEVNVDIAEESDKAGEVNVDNAEESDKAGEVNVDIAEEVNVDKYFNNFLDDEIKMTVLGRLFTTINDLHYKFTDSELSDLIISALKKNQEEDKKEADISNMSEKELVELYDKEIDNIVKRIEEILRKKYNSINEDKEKEIEVEMSNIKENTSRSVMKKFLEAESSNNENMKPSNDVNILETSNLNNILKSSPNLIEYEIPGPLFDKDILNTGDQANESFMNALEEEGEPFPYFKSKRLKRSLESRKEEVPESRKEEVPESRKEEVPESRKEEVPESRKEEVPESLKEEVPESRKEEVPESRKEEVPESLKEEVPESKLITSSTLDDIIDKSNPTVLSNLVFTASKKASRYL